jgi:hypothetical protein
MLYPVFNSCMLMTTPNPGTISFPFGTSFTLLSCEFVVEFTELVDVFVKVLLCVVDPVDVDDWVVTVVFIKSITGVCTVAVSIVAVCAFMDLLIIELGFVGLMGEIGEVGLLIFVAVITHVFDMVDQAVQVGVPYGSEHIDDWLCVITPV